MTVIREKRKYKVPGATEAIGHNLKRRRLQLKYSLGDVSDLTGFPISTIDDIEKGVTSDINYYIAYAQAIQYLLSEAFDIDIPYQPRFQLSEKKQARIFLTDNIKELLATNDFFRENRSVNDVALKLIDLQIIQKIDTSISTRISGVLLTLVEEDILIVAGKKGRNNLYKKA